MSELKQIFIEAEEKMSKSIGILKQDLLSIRTGRASPALVDKIKVEYQGYALNLNELAAILVPKPGTILIQAWDEDAVKSIMKAILKSELGLTPIQEGRFIRLNLPPLTEERRKELCKLVRRRGEETKSAIRHIRNQAIEEIRKAEREGIISKDERDRAIKQLDKLSSNHIEEVDRICREKEAEIMEE